VNAGGIETQHKTTTGRVEGVKKNARRNLGPWGKKSSNVSQMEVVPGGWCDAHNESRRRKIGPKKKVVGGGKSRNVRPQLRNTWAKWVTEGGGKTTANLLAEPGLKAFCQEL